MTAIHLMPGSVGHRRHHFIWQPNSKKEFIVMSTDVEFSILVGVFLIENKFYSVDEFLLKFGMINISYLQLCLFLICIRWVYHFIDIILYSWYIIIDMTEVCRFHWAVEMTLLPMIQQISMERIWTLFCVSCKHLSYYSVHSDPGK